MPADDKIAGQVFSDLYDRYTDSEEEEPPSERIAAYVAVLLERWCDLTEDDEDPSPWSTGPLIGEASGPLIYFPMRWSMAEEASACAAAVADVPRAPTSCVATARTTPCSGGTPCTACCRAEDAAGPRAHARGPRATHLSLFRSRWLMPNSTFGSSYRKGYPTMSAAAMKTPLGM